MQDALDELSRLEEAARRRSADLITIARHRLAGLANAPAIPAMIRIGDLTVDGIYRMHPKSPAGRYTFCYAIYGKNTLRRATVLAYLEDFLNGEQTRQPEFCEPPA